MLDGRKADCSVHQGLEEDEPMTFTRRAFVIMPFGEKKAPDGTAIDFDAVYQ